ncbi:thioredoxin family protein [Motiliproteus sediminis]|uniref:thioredoxin family protein n=1 Tax=Motiliproteus sediminis TaxID=1468178 RepID=UPI001AEFCBBE|nr:thioredoxin family protein [Motiliproteus sediminis]
MALTESSMLPLGTVAADFVLPDPRGTESLSLRAARGERGTLICFICNHCPFVKHIEQVLCRLAPEWIQRGVAVIAISANDVQAFPEDAPERMAAKDYPFPYLYDQSQQVAKAYHAACTPDFYLFDATLALVYRGQFDDSRPGNELPVSGESLSAAVNGLLQSQPPLAEQKPSIGCNIKWKTTDPQ